MLPTFLKKEIKRKFRNPFHSDQKLIIHSCYHKVGTVWFRRILSTIAAYYGLNFQKSKPHELKNNTEIFFDDHSLVDLSKMSNYVGSHMIRDPRDIIISGYFYHLRTNEKWVHEKKKEYGNKSYQEYLKSLSLENGILAEIKRTAPEIRQMAEWDYNNPNFIEIKYENIIANEKEYFEKIFLHYGFNRKAVEKSIEIANKFSIRNIDKKKSSHIRSGKPGEWKKYFSKKHKEYFIELCNDALIKLDYEQNNSW